MKSDYTKGYEAGYQSALEDLKKKLRRDDQKNAYPIRAVTVEHDGQWMAFRVVADGDYDKVIEDSWNDEPLKLEFDE